MITDVTTVVEQAIRLALTLSWFSDYTRWAQAWLDGSDRSRAAANLARARVRQWANFGGDSWAARCMTNAAAAAEELALQLPVARESARAAARCALKGKLTTPRPDPRPQDELVVGEEEYSPGPIVRGPNYHPRTYERER